MGVVLQILDSCQKPLRIVPKAAKAVITVGAEKAANNPTFVAMVNGKAIRFGCARVDWHGIIAAYGALALLTVQHGVVLLKRNAVILHQVLMPYLGGTMREVPHAASCSAARSADRAAGAIGAICFGLPREVVDRLESLAIATDFVGAIVAIKAQARSLEKMCRFSLATAAAITGKMLLHWNPLVLVPGRCR